MSLSVESKSPLSPSSGTPSGQNAGRSRLFFLFLVFWFWFSSYIYVPVLSPYVEHLGASYFMVAWLSGKGESSRLSDAG
ncbi:hypothetical protein PSTEL_03905 [Paenibacillus stellifer]|uniref:Uncharacterized protein n=1 Tax=Paenibacillus stellifer TaxID=169760 RepID=A0A089LLF3_9BACL|nr:hypothetical protein [Paenibacillus stellifer]AIQ62371.1 hypothetical protein PSTEL_03905 [Paenibacillus stellifer]